MQEGAVVTTQERFLPHGVRTLGIMIGFVVVLSLIAGVSCAAELLIKKVLTEQGEYACLSPAEAMLLKSVNEYRVINKLPMIKNSRSLNKVARVHAIDLVENRPESGVDSRGLDCNMHSWSRRGFWSPVCYTSDHYYLLGMLKKPGEITRQVYSDVAYENVYWSSLPEVFPYRAIDAWQKSHAHNALILELGKWQGSRWTALGVGIYKNVATIWFGSMPDPLGPLPACEPAPGGEGPPLSYSRGAGKLR